MVLLPYIIRWEKKRMGSLPFNIAVEIEMIVEVE